MTLTLTSGQRWPDETLILHRGTLCAQRQFSRLNHLHTDGRCPFCKKTPLPTTKVGQSHAWPILGNYDNKVHHMHTFGSLKLSFLPEMAKWAFRQNTFWPLWPSKIGQGRPFSDSFVAIVESISPVKMAVPQWFLKNLEHIQTKSRKLGRDLDLDLRSLMTTKNISPIQEHVVCPASLS